jgi:drug/metabolite transporter (DMT)-like permease
MITVSLIFLSTLAFALSAVLVRKYLDKSNFFSASIIVMVTGNIILWPLTLLFNNIGIIRLEGVILFVIAGIFEFVILKLAYYKGIDFSCAIFK